MTLQRQRNNNKEFDFCNKQLCSWNGMNRRSPVTFADEALRIAKPFHHIAAPQAVMLLLPWLKTLPHIQSKHGAGDGVLLKRERLGPVKP